MTIVKSKVERVRYVVPLGTYVVPLRIGHNNAGYDMILKPKKNLIICAWAGIASVKLKTVREWRANEVHEVYECDVVSASWVAILLVPCLDSLGRFFLEPLMGDIIGFIVNKNDLR